MNRPVFRMGPADVGKPEEVERFPVCSRRATLGGRLRGARSQSGASCPGGAVTRTRLGVPATRRGSARHLVDARSPAQCRPHSGRWSCRHWRAAAASGAPTRRTRSARRWWRRRCSGNRFARPFESGPNGCCSRPASIRAHLRGPRASLRLRARDLLGTPLGAQAGSGSRSLVT